MINKKPMVGIIMGSDSDLTVMSAAAKILDEFKVPYELTVLSAHRTPQRTYQYAKSASNRGLKVIIAGAGGSAHLPGMVASLTLLPVIGVPIQSRTMSGLDSLYSMVQMPPGIPVATMAINGSQNAGLLAVRILAFQEKILQNKLKKYVENLGNAVVKKAKRLEKVGYSQYLDERTKNS